ncbi:MAG: cation diffusion facilitator family transporter [Desulfobacteraceae bacterium]|nr:cation diffusion facilitator family transporter [Desulfobacteraceae bacterium]
MQGRKGGFLRTRLIAITWSLILGASLMALKFYVYGMTQSSAILSDALESIINVVAGAFALWSILLAAKPPDPGHPYGHGKIEYFSAGFEGALIMVAAVGIIRSALPQFLTPRELPNLESGLLILLGTSAVNLSLGLGLLRTGRKTRSLVLIADGKHVLTDVYTSAGVVAGLLVVHFTGWYWMDGAIACAVALNILVIGFKLVRKSFAGLMDAADPELLDQIAVILEEHKRRHWIDIHDLRAWRSGNRIHLDFHLILPGTLSLDSAHEEITWLQHELKNHMPDVADIFIHAEPRLDSECPICTRQSCELDPSGAGPYPDISASCRKDPEK